MCEVGESTDKMKEDIGTDNSIFINPIVLRLT